MAFRFQARAIFLTYAQCPVPKEHALTMLRTKLGEAEGTRYLIGQEKHADGNFHLHVYVERSRMIESTRANFMDLEWQREGGDDVITYHPNIESPRNRSTVKTYVTKDDNNPTVWPEDWEWKGPNKRKGKWEEATPKLLEGMTERDLLKEMPAFVLGNLRQVKEAVSFLRMQTSQALIPPLAEFLNWELPLDFGLGKSHSFHTVWSVLRGNLTNMEFGRRQLYLRGDTGIGKSTFLRHLMMCIRAYLIPTEDFYDLYEDQLYDLSVIEEFKGQKPIQWLNQWLDGATLNVRKKGSQAVKLKAIPTIILSNFCILTSTEIYPNMQETISLQTLRRRFHVVEVDKKDMHALTEALRLFLTAKRVLLPKLSGTGEEDHFEPQVRPTAVPEVQFVRAMQTGMTVQPVLATTVETANPLWDGV